MSAAAPPPAQSAEGRFRNPKAAASLVRTASSKGTGIWSVPQTSPPPTAADPRVQLYLCSSSTAGPVSCRHDVTAAATSTIGANGGPAWPRATQPSTSGPLGVAHRAHLPTLRPARIKQPGPTGPQVAEGALESSAVTSTGSFLARAVADARSDAERRAERLPLDGLRAAAVALPPARGLRAAVRRGPGGPRVIAEVKRRSPSKGDIRIDLDPAALATAYAEGGAAAVSVLTEPRHFAGSPDDLLAVRAAVDLPVLRKDFVTTGYQVWEARAWGADAVLLIVAALDPPALGSLLAEAAEAGLDALVEVHTLAEAEVAAGVGATLVGVNARDLATLEVDPGRFAAVRQALPGGTVLVAESGIDDAAGVQAAAEAGADAVLVGEALVRAANPTTAVRQLLTSPDWRGEIDRRRASAATKPFPAERWEEQM